MATVEKVVYLSWATAMALWFVGAWGGCWFGIFQPGQGVISVYNFATIFAVAVFHFGGGCCFYAVSTVEAIPSFLPRFVHMGRSGQPITQKQ